MTDLDPIGLFFGGMEKLGPGSDTDTVQVLRSLPRDRFDVVVDAGCGAGRQTLALAKALGCRIDAVDSHQPFLEALGRRAAQAGVAKFLATFKEFPPAQHPGSFTVEDAHAALENAASGASR